MQNCVDTDVLYQSYWYQLCVTECRFRTK